MPASIAHMLIFENVLSKIKSDKECDDLAKLFENDINMKYGRLGSIGPDLPYHENVAKTALSLLISKSDKPAGIEQWSGQLHSKEPNIFPLKMIEIAWRETVLDDKEWDEIAKKQWAFIIGFLTHIAADQIIHPFVNKIAGQYYREKGNREKHRECEVYQDVVLFQNKFNKSILDEKLNTWIDISPGITGITNTDPYFRIFLQKAFIEAHAIYPSEDEIENWVDGLLTVLRLLDNFGPYRTANKDFQSNKENSEKYKEFWLNKGIERPYQEFYNDAVELAHIYVKAAYELFRINHSDFKDSHRGNFLKIVKNADLTNPLDNNILEDAKKNYLEWFGK